MELPVKDSKRKHSSDMTTGFLFQVMKRHLTATFSFPSVAQNSFLKAEEMCLGDQEAVSYGVHVPKDRRDGPVNS